MDHYTSVYPVGYLNFNNSQNNVVTPHYFHSNGVDGDFSLSNRRLIFL